MRYVLLICQDEDVIQGTDPARVAAYEAFADEMSARGVIRDGQRLKPTSSATTVQVRDGDLVIADGPFAETKEQIAGYDVIDCPNLDEAIEVAAKHPVARFGAVEVRPFQPVGWWASEDRHGPAKGTRYLLIHSFDQVAEASAADRGAVPGSPADQAQRAWDAETDALGVKLGGGGLRPATEARTVRVRDGEVLVTDGPFAETKEQVGGLNVLDCASLPEAIEITSRHPIASIGTCELRAFAGE